METQITNKKITEVVKIIAKKYQPEKIILFSSFAWGKPNKDSDIDLFIVQKTDNSRKTAQEISSLFFPRFFAMDIIVYTPAQLKKELALEEPFISEVTKRGRVLFEKS